MDLFPRSTIVPDAIAAYTEKQERQARDSGFQNYDQMMAWARQRNTNTGGTVAVQRAPAQPAPAPAPPPKNILDYILGAWSSGNAGK